MLSPAPSESVATSPPQSIHTAPSSTGGPIEEFEADVDELMRNDSWKEALMKDWQESHDIEVHHLHAKIHSLWEVVAEIRRENAEIMSRITELGAAVAGDAEAKHSVCRKFELKRGRDTLVKVVTGDPSSTWETYVSTKPEGSHPSAARDLLLQAVKEAIPIYERKAFLTYPALPRSQSQRKESAWKRFVMGKRKTEENRKRRVVGQMMEEENMKRIQEAEEAQYILHLLKDEELLESFT